MAHQFTVNETIHGVSIEDFSRLVAMTSLHEAVCKRIPGENLEIIESAVKGLNGIIIRQDQRRIKAGQ